MILNVYTIIMLFASALTGILAIPAWFMSYRMYAMWKQSLHAEAKTDIENKSYLLLLMATVIVIIKLLSWPFFYVTLQSYVPEIRGAMCIFGVTQFDPSMSNALQLLKPLVFFLIGGWLLLNQLDRRAETSPLFRRKFLFLHLISFMVIADSVGDFIYFAGLKTEGSVACCTTFFDLPERATALLPLSILGAEYERYMLPAYYSFNVMLVIFMAVSYRGVRNIAPDKNNIMGATLSGAVLAALTAAVTIFAMFEVIAPRLMKLPYHHCIYCMWQYVPDSILITALFIIGVFLPCWALLLNMLGRHQETDATLRTYIMNIYFAGAVSLSASLLMVTLHLALE
ncbi:MAG: hypothetical protein C4538_04675 [Nitrospiraceae bacterium]|nr:MAG: hypothetical protein C4538_04675 [Nitrospiraceae bacterium]